MMTPFEKKIAFGSGLPENKVSQEEIIEKLVSIYKTFYLLMGKAYQKTINAPFYWNSGQAADSNHAGSTGKDRPGCGNAFFTG